MNTVSKQVLMAELTKVDFGPSRMLSRHGRRHGQLQALYIHTRILRQK